jgi:hypothetical protein
VSEADFVLMTVEVAGPSPTIEDAAKALSVPVEAVDKAFGVVVIDPERHLYAVQVKPSAVKGEEEAVPYRGPFSNPRIETMRPKEKVKRRP